MPRFNYVQLKMIEIDKWIKGEQIQRDPGKDFILNWINTNASQARFSWESSQCRKCKNWQLCGHLLKKNCPNFCEEDYQNEKGKIEKSIY